MLIRGGIVYQDGAFTNGVEVRIHHGRVCEIGAGLAAGLYETVVDLEGDYLLPGFVDVHIHAFRGHDVMRGEMELRRMSRALFKSGVSAFLPTTMSADLRATRAALDAVRRVMDRPEQNGARVLGAHMEAPFLQPSRCGAQQAEHFLAPDPAALDALLAGDAAAVRMITLAPELPGCEALIRHATSLGMVVSVGHTSATCEETHRAADWGATHVTHTFNAQSGVHHRDPGAAAAALTDDRLYAEMIADGVHLHPDILRLIHRAKGSARTVVVTDAMEAAGMPDGRYSLGGQPVLVSGGEARLVDGTLAGSVLTMPEALSRMIHRFGFAPEDAVRMCTQTPAESVGETRAGHLTPGCPAPLTRWSKDWRWKGILA